MPARPRPFRLLPPVDVLVLGAGLAGLRAALAAKESRPDASVTLASLRHEPSGSSFANRNRMLGMQVLERPDQAERFVRRAIELASPGRIDPALVACMAAESGQVFQYLRGCGLSFREDGALRVPACFFPEQASAALLTDLPRACDLLTRRLDTAGAQRMHGLVCLDLLAERCETPTRVCGALLAPVAGGPALAIPARTVILATGGPAALFERDISGAGSTGCSYALLERAGATLDNAGFLQWMWYVVGGEFFPIQELVRPGARLLTGLGDVLNLPCELTRFGPERGGHCPFGYGLPDAALDCFLAGLAGPDGTVRVALPENATAPSEWTAIAPAAHAGNGGARIDLDGRTTCPGLFACGECATGMHGANRIGGAMILATQVFGARAGRAAATQAAEERYSPPRDPQPFRPALLPSPGLHDPAHESWLARLMQTVAVFGGRPGLAEAPPRLRATLHACTAPLSALRLESGLVVLRSLSPVEPVADSGTESER